MVGDEDSKIVPLNDFVANGVNIESAGSVFAHNDLLAIESGNPVFDQVHSQVR